MISDFRILVFVSLFQAGLSYTTNIYLANKMGVDVFGQYSYVLAIAAFIAMFINWGTAETAIRLKTTYGQYAMNDIFTVRLINFIIIGIVVLVFWVFVSDSIVLLSLIVAMNALSYSTQYEAKSLNVRYAKIYLVERIAISSLICLGLFLLESRYMAWVFSIIFLVQGTSIFFQYIDNTETKLRFKCSYLANVYRQGLFQMLFGLSKYSFGGITRIIIFQVLGDAKMGIFAAAWQFVPLSTIYFSQAVKAWRLKLTEHIDGRVRSEFIKNLTSLSFYVLAPAIFAFFTLAVFGAELIDLLFSVEFVGAKGLMFYIGIYFIVVGLDTIVLLLAVAVSVTHITSVLYLVFGGATVIFCLMASEPSLEFFVVTIIVGHSLAVATASLAVFLKINMLFKHAHKA